MRKLIKERLKILSRIFGWIAAVAAILQIVGLIRYANRQPGDWLAIIFYIVTILALAALSISAFIQGSDGQS